MLHSMNLQQQSVKQWITNSFTKVSFFETYHNLPQPTTPRPLFSLYGIKVKVANTRLPNVGFRSWSRFLAVSLQVTWVINLAVGCPAITFRQASSYPRNPYEDCYQFRCLVNRGTADVNSLRLRFEPRSLCAWVQHANHSATQRPLLLLLLLLKSIEFDDDVALLLSVAGLVMGRHVTSESEIRSTDSAALRT